jgi:hypothetical protein
LLGNSVPAYLVFALAEPPVEIFFATKRSADQRRGEIFARILRRSQLTPQNQQKRRFTWCAFGAFQAKESSLHCPDVRTGRALLAAKASLFLGEAP